MLIAQLTDLHIKQSGKLAYQKVDTLGCLRRAIDHINHLNPMPDRVIITGDLADFGHPSEYQLLVSELQRLKPLVRVVPGNHDNRTHLRDALQGWLAFDTPECCNFSEPLGGYQLIGLDTAVPGQPYGMLSQASLQWLDEQLSAVTPHPALLFMHHPPMTVGLHHMDVQNLQNSDALYDVLRSHPHVAGIVVGHVHRPIVATWHRIPVWIGPSHSHAVTLDLDPQAPACFSLEPRAIQLFRLEPSGICSHISYIDAVDGPYPFFDDNHRLID
ncbi:phosphodiesterase [Vibrio spartinae]|uniref:3',5'-cyclic adenosine monophosphate phosphodiesterase CpdA n=1 Tax=Vibrio spartinae TaxID=1918945 RepID=A0ABX6QYA8_9VIBR|nr:phosphodiesterase [Vibrio spartinae]QMV14203.1 3',5'-cyclic adenosine monophosphate phosphodiesterase CpdA [Vibrio spartinae]